MVLKTVSPDADLHNADWTKRTWDLPPYKSPEFLETHHDLDVFRLTPVYKHAVDAGLIVDDEWVADFLEDDEEEDPTAPRAAGVLFVAPNGSVLLLKRSGSGDHAGEWSLPGGRVEGEETLEEGALREVREELGAVVDSAAVEELDTFPNDAGFLFTPFICRVKTMFVPRLNHEHTDYVWASQKALPDDLHPGAHHILHNILPGL